MVVAMARAVHLAGAAVHCINDFRVVHESLFRHRRASLDAAAMVDIVCVICALKMMRTEWKFSCSESWHL